MKLQLKNAILFAAVIVLGTISAQAEPANLPVSTDSQGIDLSSLLILIGGCITVGLIAWFSWHASDRNRGASTDTSHRKAHPHSKYGRGHQGIHAHHSR